MNKIVLVTGASSGIGKAISEVLASAGWTVYSVSRSASESMSTTPGITSMAMDVTKPESVAAVVDYVIRKHGKIDAVINNAGTGFNGPAENITNDEIRSNFELNVLGAWNVSRAVLPAMRSQGDGYIISISSIAGLMGLPYRSVYSATKHALEGFMESLSMEVKRFGIHVSIIEPAEFKTSIIQNRGSAHFVDTIYRDDMERVVKQINAGVAGAAEPAIVGTCVLAILNSKHPKLRYKIAPFGTKMSVVLKRILPDRMFEKILMRHFGM